MERRAPVLSALTVGLAGVLLGGTAMAQGVPSGPPPYPGGVRQDPIPSGRTIELADGDTIVINGDDRVRTIRRREGVVRLIVDMARRQAIVIADYAQPGGKAPDGRADETFTFRDLDGEWTLEPRWEGPATVEEESPFGPLGMMGSGIVSIGSARGVVKFIGYMPPIAGQPADTEGAVAVLRYRGVGRGGEGGTTTLDEAEARQVETSRRFPSGPAQGGARSRSWAQLESTQAPQGEPAAAAPGGLAPVRVGGNIAPPRKIHDVAAVTPPPAVQAGITGVVIVEITIGPDGSVADARVLRSIPLLDEAALEAVRQWRYTPTMLNGQPVPVIMTVTVNFPGM